MAIETGYRVKTILRYEHKPSHLCKNSIFL